jgi:hypothetical protein
MRKVLSTIFVILALSIFGLCQMPTGGVTFVSGGGGGITFVQSANHNVTSASTTGTVGNGIGSGWSSGNVTSGDFLFISNVSFNPNTISATDTLGTSFTCAISPVENTYYMSYCYGVATSTGADLVTETFGLSIGPTIVAFEFHGLAGTVDVTPVWSAPAAGTSWTLGGITSTHAADVIFGCGGNNGSTNTYTAGSGYTLPANGKVSGSGQSGFCEFQIVSSTGTYTPTATGTASITLIGGTFAFK